jgi:hypothetical protein
MPLRQREGAAVAVAGVGEDAEETTTRRRQLHRD